ncbi:MAG: lipid A deacylase LpxR family protein [Gemmatimonadota bacterium]
MKNPWVLMLAAFLHPLAAFTAQAQSSSESRDAGAAYQLVVDNDLFAIRGPGKADDYDYSSGIRASVLRSVAPRWGRRLMRANRPCDVATERARGCTMAAFEFSHRIYTPRPNSALPLPGERPYAGLLQGSVELVRVTPGHSRLVALDAGVTGRLSLAEQLQNQLHRILDNTPRLGWDAQLPNAAAVSLRYAEGVRGQATHGRAFTAVDVKWGALAGNVTNAASAGAEFSAGIAGTLPWSPSEPRMEQPGQLYVTVGYQQDAVLHNVLVEGRGTGPGGVRRPLVGQLEGGVGLRHRHFSAVYKHLIRGREYDAQLRRQSYGTIALSVNRF